MSLVLDAGGWTLVVKISSVNSEILLLLHFSCRALEFGGFAFVFIVVLF